MANIYTANCFTLGWMEDWKQVHVLINYGEVKILIKRIYILTNTQAVFGVVHGLNKYRYYHY